MSWMTINFLKDFYWYLMGSSLFEIICFQNVRHVFNVTVFVLLVCFLLSLNKDWCHVSPSEVHFNLFSLFLIWSFFYFIIKYFSIGVGNNLFSYTNYFWIFESFFESFLSLAHLIDNSAKNLDEQGWNIMSEHYERTYIIEPMFGDQWWIT